MSETFTEPQILELGSRRLWIQLLRSRLLEEASAGFEPEAEEVENSWASFCKRYQLNPENPTTVPPEFKGCPPAILTLVVEREVRVSACSPVKNSFSLSQVSFLPVRSAMAPK